MYQILFNTEMSISISDIEKKLKQMFRFIFLLQVKI